MKNKFLEKSTKLKHFYLQPRAFSNYLKSHKDYFFLISDIIFSFDNSFVQKNQS